MLVQALHELRDGFFDERPQCEFLLRYRINRFDIIERLMVVFLLNRKHETMPKELRFAFR